MSTVTRPSAFCRSSITPPPERPQAPLRTIHHEDGSTSQVRIKQEKPRFDRELLDTYGKGLIGTTGCPSGEVNRWLQAGNYDRALAAAADMRDILGPGNYFAEVMDHGLAIERRFREDLLKIARTLDLPLVATNDLHYVRAGDADTHDVLLCIGTRTTMSSSMMPKMSKANWMGVMSKPSGNPWMRGFAWPR